MGLFSFLGRGNQAQQFTLDGVRFEVSYSAGDSDKITVDLLSLPSMANALDLKSNDLAQLPLCLYARTDNGRERLRNNLDYRLSQQPNAYQNASQFWKTVGMQSMLAECFISTRGGEFNILPFGRTVKYKTPFDETRYAVLMTPEEKAQAGLPANAPGIAQDFAYNEVLHIFESQDEHGNALPLRVRFKAVLGLGSDLYSYSCKLLNRGGVLAGYLTTDHTMDLDKKKENVSWFKDLFRSASTSTTGSDLRVSILDGGLRFNALNLTPQEMMIAEHRNDFRADVADMLHMPRWKLGLLESYKYASAEQAGRDYLQQCLNPLLTQIEREVNTKLIADFERPFLYLEFNRDKAIAIDSKTMAEIDDLGLKGGGMSLNEWCARRNLSSVEGGDIRQIPVNNTSAVFVQQSEALKLAKLSLEVEAAKRTTGQNELKTTVGGSQSLASYQRDYFSGAISREAAIAAAQLVFGFSLADSESLFPMKSPSPAAPTELKPALETLATPADPAAPVVAVADPAPAAGDFAASLRAVQTKYAADPAAQEMDKPELLSAMLRSICGEVATLHGLTPEHLATFAEKYIASATKRLTDIASPKGSDHELNRAVNAANHEALRLAHGVKINLRWVGGANDGQTKSITDCWTGTLRHPPITDGETDCFLVREIA